MRLRLPHRKSQLFLPPRPENRTSLSLGRCWEFLKGSEPTTLRGATAVYLRVAPSRGRSSGYEEAGSVLLSVIEAARPVGSPGRVYFPGVVL